MSRPAPPPADDDCGCRKAIEAITRRVDLLSSRLDGLEADLDPYAADLPPSFAADRIRAAAPIALPARPAGMSLLTWISVIQAILATIQPFLQQQQQGTPAK